MNELNTKRNKAFPILCWDRGLLALGALFFIYAFLNFWGLNIKELQGDEASSLLAVIPAMKFYQNPKWLASIFIFSHAPIRALVEIPFLYIFGLREFWLYLPNVLASLGLFWINLLILKKWFSKETALIGSAFLAVNGGIILQRMVMGVGFFVFFTSLMVYYFYSFLENKKIRKFELSLLFLFLAILTYVEAIIFIPIIFYWLKKENSLQEKKILKSLLLFFLFIVIFFSLWLIIPFLAFRFGFISDLFDAGMFRILKRVGGGFALNLIYNFNLLKYYNSLAMTILLIGGLIFSFLEKKSFFFWSFLAPPLVYFSIIKSPTIHLFNYLNLIIITSSIGWLRFFNFFKARIQLLIKSIFYSILLVTIFINVSFLKEEYYSLKSSFEEIGWGGLVHNSLKSTAYVVRKETDSCDKIYTDIEGYIARIYFGRRYTQNSKEAKVVVLKKDPRVNRNYEKLFDQEYASFKNFMPYLKCQN